MDFIRNDDELAYDLKNYDNYIILRRLHLSRAKLKGVTELAAFMSGFSVIATVEVDYHLTKPSEGLLLGFTITTACLVSTTMLSIMIATCILPHIAAVVKMNSPILAQNSPHEEMVWYIDIAWFLGNTASIFLFIVDVILLCWIQFPGTPAVCVTFIMIPVLLLLSLFGLIFYRKTVRYHTNVAERRIDELKALSVKLNMENV